MHSIYDTLRWRALSARARRRDGSRCTVSRLLGGDCNGTLHAHHIRPVEDGGDPYDLENVATVCASHHPVWEALRRRLLRIQDRDLEDELPPRCPHRHQTAEARAQCEARMARARARVRTGAAA